MKKRKPLTNKDGEVRELTKEDFMEMRPMEEVLPPELVKIIKNRKRGERGKQRSPTKLAISIRFTPRVIKYFKLSGKGWQSKINKVLEDYVKKHEKDAA